VAVISTSTANASDVGYATGVRREDFIKVLLYQPGIIEELKNLNPIAVIAGSESGVQLADQLANLIAPGLANDLHLSKARRNKWEMQLALEKAGLPIISTINSASADEVTEWLKKNKLTEAALIVKPPLSAGSDNVHHVPAGGDWESPFYQILSAHNGLIGGKNETVIVQEQVLGTEYAVDTVSANGQHVLSHLIRYTKKSAGERKTVFDHTEFIPLDSKTHGQMFSYVQKALDALGIRWGAAHSEVMLTKEGPRLIETGARMCGGPVLGFAKAATGSSQLERVLEAYVDGEIRSQQYDFKQTVVPVFLSAPISGVLQNAEVLDSLRLLPTHLATSMWRKNGDFVRQTVDFDTTLGIIALAGDRNDVFDDYKRVRDVETQLSFKQNHSERMKR
ncbi:MAG: ATP-grasp domain-containing protein, partial [Bdellovibrionales bacterium]|nr:ATP-grasp domain-containing protein [Bdellovibrionales bacterium]